MFMPRPVKLRHIKNCPHSIMLKPAGFPDAMKVILTVDEYEAVRLADLEGKYQADAAEEMGISRQTFGNILKSAHMKLADVIVNSKALSLEGAESRQNRCSDCNSYSKKRCGCREKTQEEQ